MRRTNLKAMVAQGLTIGLLAGAVAIAMPAKAQAQEFGVGVGFATPVLFEHPRFDYARRDGFEFQRREAIRREEFRHEEWARAHRFDHDRFQRYGR